MERETRNLKPVAYGAVVFITLGITIANETLSRFGLEENYLAAFSAAFVLAALLVANKVWLTVAVLFGVVLINLPVRTLLGIPLDKDVLLALICGLILVPTVYDLVAGK